MGLLALCLLTASECQCSMRTEAIFSVCVCVCVCGAGGQHTQLARAKEASNKLEEEVSAERLKLKQAQLEGGQLRSQVIEVGALVHVPALPA